MPNELDRGYFGVRLGDALSQGAGHIAGALQNKYMTQRQNSILEEEKKRQGQDMMLKAAQMGIVVDPNNPGAMHEQIMNAANQIKAQKTAETETEKARAGYYKQQAEALAAKPKPATEAQKAVDRAFGKEYASYVAGGGSGEIAKEIDQLDVIKEKLKSGKENLTGPGISLLPDSVRERAFPASKDTEDNVLKVVQKTLRQTLGAQFTENEGKLFMKRGYNIALKEDLNAKRISNMIDELRMMAQAKQEAIDYYEQNGTLTGFKGKVYTVRDGEVRPISTDEAVKVISKEAGIGNELEMENKPVENPQLGKNEIMRKNSRTGEIGVFDKTTGKRIR